MTRFKCSKKVILFSFFGWHLLLCSSSVHYSLCLSSLVATYPSASRWYFIHILYLAFTRPPPSLYLHLLLTILLISFLPLWLSLSLPFLLSSSLPFFPLRQTISWIIIRTQWNWMCWLQMFRAKCEIMDSNEIQCIALLIKRCDRQTPYSSLQTIHQMRS